MGQTNYILDDMNSKRSSADQRKDFNDIQQSADQLQAEQLKVQPFSDNQDLQNSNENLALLKPTNLSSDKL